MWLKDKMKIKSVPHIPHNRRLLLFALAFGLTGGVFLIISTRAAIQYADYPPHHASCVSNTPSKTSVKPGENFSAVVKLRNDGSSTWSSSYGFYLGEFRDGASIWSPSGHTLTNSVSPGATKQFNLSVKAPSQTGSYSFNWGMAIVYNGFVQNPCLGKTVTVMNTPTVSLKANGQNSNISLTKGSKLTLSWSSSPSITSCQASGSWSGSKAASGSADVSSATGSTGTKNFTLTCSNAVGSKSVTRSVTVNSAPSSGGGTSEPPSSSGGGTSQPSTSNGSPNPVLAPVADTSAPSKPGEFIAESMSDSTVSLRWTASTDNLGVKGYQLDRSTDQKNWQAISGDELLNQESFSDTDVVYQTKYYYRVRARDDAGNFSSYAQTEVTTESFQANTSMDQDTTLNSDDGIVTVVIPAGAAGVAHCSLRINHSVLPPTKDSYQTLAGPYEVLCKNAKGTIVSSFSTPITVSLTLNEQQKKDHQVLAYMIYKENDWEEVDTTPTDALKSFEMTDNSSFAVLAETKSTPLWKRILLILGIIGLMVGGALFAINFYLRFKRRRQIERQYQDYYHKERGY